MLLTALENAVEVSTQPDHDGVCGGGGNPGVLLGSQGADQARGAERWAAELTS